MACWACWFVEVYDAISDVVLWWSVFGFVAVLWVGGVLVFYLKFTFDFPWRGCSGHVECFLSCCRKRGWKYKSLGYAAGVLGVCAITSSLPAASRMLVTSSSDAPLVTFILSSRGATWFMLTLLRFTPVSFFGPVTSTKLLSITSMMTHFLPVSRPACLTHILPSSIAGVFNVSLLVCL